jgi:hypothetical protein
MILEIDGVRFKLNKRKAKVGEKVLLNHNPLRITEIEAVYGLTVVDILGKENYHHDYIVMEEIIEPINKLNNEIQFKEMTNNAVIRAMGRLSNTEKVKDSAAMKKLEDGFNKLNK